jgi:hypothetical protein
MESPIRPLTVERRRAEHSDGPNGDNLVLDHAVS